MLRNDVIGLGIDVDVERSRVSKYVCLLGIKVQNGVNRIRQVNMYRRGLNE